jgi:hypothetical protein
MRTSSTRNRRSMLRTISLALGLAIVTVTTAAAPARADSDDWRYSRDRDGVRWDRDHRNREDWREREEREHRAGIYYGSGYSYAPPPVVYGPPPSGFNIYIPLDIH